MGCFPSRRCDDEADGDSFIDLDLDNTPLLHETSRSQHYRENVILEPKHENHKMAVDTRLETLLLKLEHAREMDEKIERITSEAELEIHRLKIVGILNTATMEMSRLIKENRHHDTETVVQGIMRMKAALGDEFLEAANIIAFGREITDMGSYLLTGGQYFKPAMIQEDDDSIVKLYFFVISEADTANVLFRYYLEHASFLDEYFALGLVTQEGHTQVEIYGSSCPSYWKIRQDVINNATARLTLLLESSEFDELFNSSLP